MLTLNHKCKGSLLISCHHPVMSKAYIPSCHIGVLKIPHCEAKFPLQGIPLIKNRGKQRAYDAQPCGLSKMMEAFRFMQCLMLYAILQVCDYYNSPIGRTMPARNSLGKALSQRARHKAMVTCRLLNSSYLLFYSWLSSSEATLERSWRVCWAHVCKPFLRSMEAAWRAAS